MQPASNVTVLHPDQKGKTPASQAGDDRRTSERAMWWFKLTNDCTRDPLIRTIARRSGQPSGQVFAVMVALRAEASGAKDRGSVVGFDAETVADAFDVDEQSIAAIVQALADKGWIVDGRIADWEKTQPARDEKNSTGRVQKHRAKNEAALGDAPTERHETSTDRHETPRNGLESELELESDSDRVSISETISRSNESRSPVGAQVAFDDFWAAWPNKVGKRDAQKAFPAALKRAGGDASKIMTGIETYKAKKAPDQRWMNPATFLNGDRFEDQPAPPADPDEVDPMGWCYDPGDMLGEGKKMRRSAFEREHGKFSRVRKWEPLKKEVTVAKTPARQDQGWTRSPYDL